MAGGILWLASYPKSGNTWLRAFLANYIENGRDPVPLDRIPKYATGDNVMQLYAPLAGKPVETLSEAEFRALRPKVHEHLATRSANTVMLKTHNYLGHEGGVPLITPRATAGAVYVMRNPLDVALSFAHHLGQPLDEAVKALEGPDTILEGEADRLLLPSIIGGWTQHVRSWTEMPGLQVHVMRYEDMLTRPGPTFGRLVDFLQLPREAARLARAIKNCSFQQLAAQERTHGFVEATPGGGRFFRAGRSGEWRAGLKEAQVARLLAACGPVMKTFGYLDESGQVVDDPGRGRH